MASEPCPTHPAYTGERMPRSRCEACWRFYIDEQDRRAAEAYNAALPVRLAKEKADLVLRLYGTPESPKYPHRDELCDTCGQWPMWNTPRSATTHRQCLPCWDKSADW